jgi:UDP-N-acetylmuramyl pentapeptide synthase
MLHNGVPVTLSTDNPRASSTTLSHEYDLAAALADNDGAVDWLRGHLAAGDVVLVKASRGARPGEVAAALS